MRAQILLCDSAQLDQGTGKMHILGAGWSVTGPQIPPFAVAVFFQIPWEEAAGDHTFAIRLVSDDDQPVFPLGSTEEKPVAFRGNLQLNPDSPHLEDSAMKVDVHSAFAVNAPALRVPAGQRYRWIVEIDGVEIGSAEFAVRPEPDSSEEEVEEV